MLAALALLAGSAAAQQLRECCFDHPNKPSSPPSVANYDCSQLVPFGADRCNKVWGGGVCSWGAGDECPPAEPKECQRVENIVVVNLGKQEQKVDIGRCVGRCPNGETKCTPITETKRLPNGESLEIVVDCNCDSCFAVEDRIAIEVPAGRCKGDCPAAPRDRVCLAGRQDNYDQTNQPEPSSPSLALLAGPLTACSAGIQPGFDTFADNRCFGHTFETLDADGNGCFERDPTCPLSRAVLRICMRAANVALTNTDSMRLGTNGNGLWGISLPALNGGSWNRNDENCWSLDLSSLPNGGDILNDVNADGNLDVFVQDDTAIDFLELSLQYEDCQKCLPTDVSISSLYSEEGVKDIKNVKDCDCVDASECTRQPLHVTYFPGTIFQTTIDQGQCVGGCNRRERCAPVSRRVQRIKAPEGERSVPIIAACKCT